MDSHTTNAQNAHAQNLDAEKKARLAELVKELAVVHGKVTLSSGKEADYYVDLRRITLHHEAAPLVGRVMLDLLRREGLANLDALALRRWQGDTLVPLTPPGPGETGAPETRRTERDPIC